MVTGKNILIVDDDEISRLVNKTVVDSLAESRITATEAVNCFDALDLIVEQYSKYKTLPDLILLDINMPIMHAFDFMDHLQRLRFLKYMSIIIVTTSSDPVEQARASEMGVKYFFTKPANSALLKEAILEIIGHS